MDKNKQVTLQQQALQQRQKEGTVSLISEHVRGLDFGKASKSIPIRYVEKREGRGIIISVLVAMFTQLGNFIRLDANNEAKLFDWAELLLIQFPEIKIDELLHCFTRLTSGKYENKWGSLSYTDITSVVQRYLSEAADARTNRVKDEQVRNETTLSAFGRIGDSVKNAYSIAAEKSKPTQKEVIDRSVEVHKRKMKYFNRILKDKE